MPVAAGVGIATAVAGIYGAHKQSQSTDNAAAIKAKSDAAALGLATSQENTRKQEYDAQQLLLKQQWDAQQQIRAPYRAAGANALSNLGNILGVDFGQGYTGPTPSNPSTFGQPATPGQNAVSGGPSPTNPNAFNLAAFNQGTQTIQDQLNQSPAGQAPTSGPQQSATAPPSPGTPPSPSPTPTDQAGILAALTKQYGDLGTKPTGPGTGPTDISYYAQKIAETGGLTQDNINYWFGPSGRIANDLAKSTSGGTKSPTATSLSAPTAGPPLSITPLGGVNTPGYAPIIPISGLMGRGPYQ